MMQVMQSLLYNVEQRLCSYFILLTKSMTSAGGFYLDSAGLRTPAELKKTFAFLPPHIEVW